MKRPKRGWYHPISLTRGFLSRPKLYLAIICAVGALFVLPLWLPLAARAAAAWNVGGIVYMTLAFMLFRTCNVDLIRKRAAGEDESAIVFLFVVLAAIASSFTASVILIGEAKTALAAKHDVGQLYIALAGLTIVVSWVVTQLVFTLHYAHAYYQPQPNSADALGGLEFPKDPNPDYWDFFYFTTSIGATSQTSDVAITSKSLRRLVALQAVISFLFNTTVLALSINLAASLI